MPHSDTFMFRLLQISESATVIVDAEEPKYVCRGGLKLEGALKDFKIDVTGAAAPAPLHLHLQL